MINLFKLHCSIFLNKFETKENHSTEAVAIRFYIFPIICYQSSLKKADLFGFTSSLMGSKAFPNDSTSKQIETPAVSVTSEKPIKSFSVSPMLNKMARIASALYDAPKNKISLKEIKLMNKYVVLSRLSDVALRNSAVL